MIRFLILCTIAAILYLLFNTLAEFDTNISLTLLDYQIETTIFTCLAIFIIAQLFSTLLLKLFFLIIGLPNLIQRSWRDHALEQNNQKLIKALACLLIKSESKSGSLISNISKISTDPNQEIVNLICAEQASDPQERIEYLTMLIGSKNYNIYAAKNLSKIFLQLGQYKKAESYAVQAFNADNSNLEIMLLLIKIYNLLKKWSKLAFIFSKIKQSAYPLKAQQAREIAKSYYQAAIFFVKENSEQEALTYLEISLELDPIDPAALNLFTELARNNKDIIAILRVLKNAFTLKPSFYTAKLYIKNSNYTDIEIYHNLASMTEPRKYPHVFLAIAAYLGLEEKIDELRSL